MGSTPEIAQRMGADLAAGQVVVLPGLHHLASLEDPNAVNTILLEFIRANS
ncbi:MAG: hypothetical protein HOL03_00315 [Acidiferrobacteraceae bacterium]|nr:hypothetical protein [Acidiferrobacteraceae bacterium]